MTSESDESRRWILEPPAAGQFAFRISGGEGAQLTPEIQKGLEALMKAIAGAEVAGYVISNPIPNPSCRQYSFDCKANGPCSYEYQHPWCEVDYQCTIGVLPR